uniref:Uncharacterized protein n=1 Tax=Panagrolaimus davidi TaxID=227884 RepID=A0A914Q4X4_9BILA
MLYIGITDFILLFLNGFLTGLLGIFGIVHCQYPKQMYIIGGIGISLWCTQSTATVILGLNRCFEMWDKKLTVKYFEGKKVYLWLLIPTVYFFVVFGFTMPAMFSPFVMAWLFDPHTGYFDDQQSIVS